MNKNNQFNIDLQISTDFIISLVENSGIKKDIGLSEKEIKILEKASLHNNGVVNLLSNTEEISNLFNKCLLHLSEDGGFIVTNMIVNIIFNTCKNTGSFLLYDNDDSYSNKNSGQLANEIKRVGKYNDNIVSISWDLPCVV